MGTQVKKEVKLPLPSASDVLQKSLKTSIYTTKSHIQDVERSKVLEQHVKMVQNITKTTSTVNGQQVCALYSKRGRCRFGKNCKFFHDSQLQVEPEHKGKEVAMKHRVVMRGAHDDMEEVEDERKRKKRYGVTDSLHPPKRALYEIHAIKKKERKKS